MKCLFFGDRNLTWRHLPVMRALARHAIMEASPDLRGWLVPALADTDALEWRQRYIPDSEPLVCIHGDGPPGTSTPGAIGADKLAELACMETWPERRRARRFPPDVKPGATHNEWAAAAAKRNAQMVAMKPDRVYAVHLNLDSSKGSSAGAVLEVERR